LPLFSDLLPVQNKIKDSQQGNSFSEDELEQYEKVKEEISKLEQKQEKQEKDKNEITALKNFIIFNQTLVIFFFNNALNKLVFLFLVSGNKRG
jgi:hypothetical protein